MPPERRVYPMGFAFTQSYGSYQGLLRVLLRNTDLLGLRGLASGLAGRPTSVVITIIVDFESFLAHFLAIFRIQTSIFKCIPFQGYWELDDVAGLFENLRLRCFVS